MANGSGIATFALLVALGAVVVAFVVPGPQGTQGPAGPSGSGGSAALVVSDYASNFVQLPTQGCQAYTDAQITVNAPSTGDLVVSAMVAVAINRNPGAYETVRLYLVDTIRCTNSAFEWTYQIPPESPVTSQVDVTAHLHAHYQVSAGATFTVYLTGYHTDAQAVVQVQSASLLGTFYPD